MLEKDYKVLYNKNVFRIRKRVSQYETESGIIIVIKSILKCKKIKEGKYIHKIGESYLNYLNEHF